jgi:hypothetical protein
VVRGLEKFNYFGTEINSVRHKYFQNLSNYRRNTLKPHLRFLLGSVDFSTKLRKTLDGSNLTLTGEN